MMMRQGANDYLMKDNLMRLGTVMRNELADAVAKRERKLLDKALYEISTAVLHTGIDDFLNTILLQLANSLQADRGIIGIYKDFSEKEIATLCYCVNGKLANNFTYSLEGTPCAHVLQNEVCAYPENVAELFPNDKMFQTSGIEGYIGIQLCNSSGKVFGIITLLYNTPIQFVEVKKNILRFYATRVAFEIERSQTQQALIESEQRFAAIFKNSPVGITLVSLNDGVFRDVNDIMLSRIGLTKEEVIGQTTETLQLYKNIEDRNEIFETLTQKGTVENKEIEFINKQGKNFFCLVSVSVVNIGGVAFLLSSVMDINESKIAQQKLQASEAKVSAYFNSTTEAIVMVGIDKKVLLFNKVFEGYVYQLFNKNVHAGEHILQYITPSLATSFEKDLEKAYSGQTVYAEVIIPISTTEKWMAVSLLPVRDSEATIIGVAINHLDITDRKIAEQKLIDSENKLAAYFNSTTDSIILIATDFSILAFNKVCENLIWQAFNRQIAVGDNVIDYMDDIVREGFINNFNTALAGEEITTEREVHYIEDKIWWRLNYNPIRNSDGNIMGVSFTSTNISDKKLGEKILQESEEKFRSMVHNISDIITLLDSNGNILYQSGSILQALGYTADETIGRNIFELLHPDDIQFIAEEMEKILLDESYEPTLEYSFLNKAGNYILMEAKANNQLQNPAVNAIIVNSRDITQRKTVEAAIMKQAHDLAVSNIELERFAYIASHDLQEPLRMVSSFMNLLQKKYNNQLDETANQYINFAVDGSNRMKQLITDLLRYAQIGVKPQPAELVDMHNAVAELQIVLQHKIEDTGTSISTEGLPTGIAIKTDIDQLLQNLIGNAIKYQAPASKPIIHIKGEERSNDWLISVQDNGIGISPAFKDKIFVVFQRLHTKDAYSGTGIGLSICKKIIDKAGGKIWVESEPGKGSTFYFTILKPKKTASIH
jgi:PAS domain S-box-containing protein